MMNELKLLEELQTIQNKLKNNEKLTDREYKLFACMLFVTLKDFLFESVKVVLKIMKGDNNE